MDTEIIQKLENDDKVSVYVKNAYKLGYKTIEMMLESNGSLKNISLEATKITGEMITKGEVDELLAE